MMFCNFCLLLNDPLKPGCLSQNCLDWSCKCELLHILVSFHCLNFHVIIILCSTPSSTLPSLVFRHPSNCRWLSRPIFAVSKPRPTCLIPSTCPSKSFPSNPLNHLPDFLSEPFPRKRLHRSWSQAPRTNVVFRCHFIRNHFLTLG